MYLIANVVLNVYREKVGQREKIFFSVLTGALLQTSFIYVVYLAGGAKELPSIVYLLVVTPNPFFVLVHYYVGTKFLKLSAVRSIKLVGFLYHYYLFVINLSRLVESIFFIQQTDRYNYMQDAFQQITFFVIIICAYQIAKRLLNKNQFTIRLTERVFVSSKKEYIFYFLKAAALYTISIALPLLIIDQPLAYFLVLLILALAFCIIVYADIKASMTVELANKDVHIDALSKGISEFNDVRHDFYNILQTYEGYLAVGKIEELKRYHATLLHTTTRAGSAMDLGQRMGENPAFISLLLNKIEYADSLKVKMTTTLLCDLEDLFIDNFDICRCVSCLLDNAIEAAADSMAQKVQVTVEAKGADAKLIIITNSTAKAVDSHELLPGCVSTKAGHKGLGLSIVRKIIGKYGNCTFHTTYYNYELSAYMAIRANVE